MRSILCAGILFGILFSATAQAATLDFTSLDYPPLNENQTIVVSDGGVSFTMVPIDNLVGAPRWVGGDRIQFGGGGGSSLEFDFTPDTDVTLETYTIDINFILGNPNFQIREGLDVLSASNDADALGTFGFDGGSIALEAGTTYTFETNAFGAAIQSAFTAWDFTVIPEPSTLCFASVAALVLLRRRLFDRGQVLTSITAVTDSIACLDQRVAQSSACSRIRDSVEVSAS